MNLRGIGQAERAQRSFQTFDELATVAFARATVSRQCRKLIADALQRFRDRWRELAQVATQARREPDEARRNQLYQQADSIAFVQAPMIFMFFYNELYAVQPWIRGFEPPVIFNGQRWLNVSIGDAAAAVAKTP